MKTATKKIKREDTALCALDDGFRSDVIVELAIVESPTVVVDVVEGVSELLEVVVELLEVVVEVVVDAEAVVDLMFHIVQSSFLSLMYRTSLGPCPEHPEDKTRPDIRFTILYVLLPCGTNLCCIEMNAVLYVVIAFLPTRVSLWLSTHLYENVSQAMYQS